MARIEEIKSIFDYLLNECDTDKTTDDAVRKLISLLTPAPIPGLDLAIQSALIEYYIGGKPVEGWAWDYHEEHAIRCELTGFSGGVYHVCTDYSDFEPFNRFSLTDPRENKKEPL